MKDNDSKQAEAREYGKHRKDSGIAYIKIVYTCIEEITLTKS